MRIFCWNVNSLVPTVRNINLKYGSLEAFFKHLDADIVCMQEVKLPQPKLTKELVVVPGYQSYWACSEGKTGYSGVTTWARESVAAVKAEADTIVAKGCEREGRAVITDHGAFVLVNVYVPNAGDRPDRARLPAKLAFLQALQERVDAALGSGRQVIAVGDFNIASEPRDVHSAITWDTLYAQSEMDALRQLTTTLTDTWRQLHPEQEGVYTVWDEKTSARAFNVGLRIDYALCSKQLLGHVQSCEVLLDMPPKWSDHAPVMLELQLPAAAAAELGQQQQQQQQQTAVCPMWRDLLKRFADPSQRSIASMFKAAKPSSSNKPAAAAGVSQQIATGGKAAAAAGGTASRQAATDAQQTSTKRSLDDAAAAEDLGTGQTSSAPGAETNTSSRGAKSARLDESVELRTALQEEELKQQTQKQLKEQQQDSEGRPEQQQQQQQPVTQQPKANASAAAGEAAKRCGSKPVAGAGRSADRTGSELSTGKQAGKSSGSNQTDQQLAGRKQSSLHAFLARPPP